MTYIKTWYTKIIPVLVYSQIGASDPDSGVRNGEGRVNPPPWICDIGKKIPKEARKTAGFFRHITKITATTGEKSVVGRNAFLFSGTRNGTRTIDKKNGNGTGTSIFDGGTKERVPRSFSPSEIRKKSC